MGLEHVDKLSRAGGFGDDDIVRKEEGERLIAHGLARGEDGIADAPLLVLLHVDDVGELGDPAHLIEPGGVAFLLQRLF